MNAAPIKRPQRWDKPFSDEMSDADVDRLLTIPPFSNIDPAKFSRSIPLGDILKNDTRIVRYENGDIIVREGDWGNTAFFIISGVARVELEGGGDNPLPAAILGRREVRRKNLFQSLAQLWKNHRQPEVRDAATYSLDARVASRGSGESTRIYLQDVPAVLDAYRTARIESGQFFGELAALGRSPRSATVFADGDAELLEIRWQGLRDIMRRADQIREHIDSIYRERALASFLRATPLFSHLSKEEMEELVEQTELETFGQFDWAGSFKKLVKKGNTTDLAQEPLIACEGDYPNGVIIIRNGVARLSRKYHHGHRTVGYLTPGHVYGFEEIAQASKNPIPLARSLRAIGYLAVAVVPTQLIERFVLDGGRSNSTSVRAAQVPGVGVQEAGVDVNADMLEFFVERRYVNGTATMLINLDRCTRCDDCVKACAETHDNNPRFIRHGPIQGNYMVANACMHCEDPVCMIQCPTGAIHRETRGGEVTINPNTCIGCTLCANNCPYDAIRMVEVRTPDGRMMLDEKNTPLRQATKCDLCIDQIGGPSCQRACPHDALARVDMRDVESLAKWLNR